MVEVDDKNKQPYEVRKRIAIGLTHFEAVLVNRGLYGWSLTNSQLERLVNVFSALVISAEQDTEFKESLVANYSVNDWRNDYE